MTFATIEKFKKQVFAKTNGKCCVPGCTCDAVDAHHILDRHLWYHGGYILSNGAALCEKHHLDAENGIITPKQCIEYMHISPKDIQKPDEIKSLSLVNIMNCLWVVKLINGENET